MPPQLKVGVRRDCVDASIHQGALVQGLSPALVPGMLASGSPSTCWELSKGNAHGTPAVSKSKELDAVIQDPVAPESPEARHL